MKKFNLDLAGKIAFAFFLITFTICYVSLYVMDNELRYFEHSHTAPIKPATADYATTVKK